MFTNILLGPQQSQYVVKDFQLNLELELSLKSGDARTNSLGGGSGLSFLVWWPFEAPAKAFFAWGPDMVAMVVNLLLKGLCSKNEVQLMMMTR